MIRKSLVIVMCAAMVLPGPVLAQQDAPLRPTNAYGRDTLCVDGTVETKLGCVPEAAAGAARPLAGGGAGSAAMRACMAAAAGEMPGFRARYRLCQDSLSGQNSLASQNKLDSQTAADTP